MNDTCGIKEMTLLLELEWQSGYYHRALPVLYKPLFWACKKDYFDKFSIRLIRISSLGESV